MKTVGISEARKHLPELCEKVARDGTRVDVVRRGKPMVSIVRTADLERGVEGDPGALAVELRCDPAELVDVVRDLRERVGRARSVPRAGKRNS